MKAYSYFRRVVKWTGTVLIFLYVSCATQGRGFRTEASDVLLRVLSTDEGGALNAELVSPYLPALVLHGYVETTGPGEATFSLLGIKIFDNWSNGWTEGEFDATGVLVLRREYLSWRSEVREPFSVWGAAKGEIRYYDRYFRGEDGARKVKARFDRITAAVDFLRTGEGRAREGRSLLYGGLDGETPLGPALGPLVRSFFFPKERDPSFFPENLRPLIESDTLFRDWEETPGLWLSLYNLPGISARLKNGALFRYEE